MIFEVSFEVCNKVGGIYTVIKSKAPRMVEYYGDKYCAVGSYDRKKSPLEFDTAKTPASMKGAFDDMEKSGIKCYYGTWLISGRPKAILIDSSGFMKEANRIKGDLWEHYKVDSIKSEFMFDEPVVWAFAAGMLVEKLAGKSDGNVSAQFHEWLAGAGLLYLKMNNSPVGCVFTTHATTLGRTLAGADVDLYKMVNEGVESREIASLDLARRYGVLAKHTMEVACANVCDVFSTVSEITGKEAQYTLGRKPDILLPNGITMEENITVEELAIMRREYRKHMRAFFSAYFSRYYEIDFDHIRSIFISGRYEFHNKGLDIFIESLGKINERLRSEKSKRIVIAFISVPASVRGEKTTVLKDHSLYREMEECIEENLPYIKGLIMDSLVRGKIPKDTCDLFDDEFVDTCRNMVAHFIEKRGQSPAKNPPLCAFELDYPEENDPIISALAKNGLLNREGDNVKVIFYPAYLAPGDRLIGLSYDKVMMTFDLAVFPSYYEPWGYTPLEAAKMGVMAVTTDLSGFGKFIGDKSDGISVIKRDNRPDRDVVEDLTNKVYQTITLARNERVNHRLDARRLASLADWSVLAKNYVKAHEMALEKAKKNKA
ncbi:MAG: hypothetical protein MSIBF_04355 [Candidatus Altiarchaeales archaeon IMC4]|nr:MAG: hypothetical protein MSIBF_04355 [Candidatus Altiarchaeales archaeon IMC4]